MRPARPTATTAPPGGSPEPATAPRRVGMPIGLVTGVLVLAGVVALATHLAEERELARLVREAQPLWLVGALACQVLTYACAAAVWQRALAFRGVAMRVRSLLPLGLAKLFTDQAVPSAGMSGTLLVVRGLIRRGISRSAAVAAVLTGLVGFYVAYLLATLAAVAVLWVRGELGLLFLVPAAVLGVLAVGVPLVMVVLRRRGARRPPRWLLRLPGARAVIGALAEAPAGTLFAPRLLAEIGLLQLAIFALDALTLDATLRAVASPVGFPVVFASFVAASVVSTLAWVPGGLGTFEGSCVAMLHFHGVPVGTALAATLLLRGLTFWLPMVPGFVVARHEASARRPPPGR